MKRMTSFVQQTIQNLALGVEHRWSLPQFDAVDWTYLETFSTLVTTIDELHKCIDDSLHWRQQTFLLQTVVEVARADTGPGHVRTDGVEGDVILWQEFAIGSDESHDATGRVSQRYFLAT
jgi:hypothetical protein